MGSRETRPGGEKGERDKMERGETTGEMIRKEEKEEREERTISLRRAGGEGLGK